MSKISVVINTRNEEKNLPRALTSLKNFADEIIVVDMHSNDRTVDIAKKHKAKVFHHKEIGYVEPARNFAISKATGDWILILDADEELPPTLASKLKKIASSSKSYDFYRLPRKNIIFNKWIKHSRWWPDYNIRFFKKGKVSWNELIHSVPVTEGKGYDLEEKDSYAIVHYNYNSISQFIDRMNRYTDVQAANLHKEGYKFNWQDLFNKPLGEFLSRFFAGEGYKDGVHGLALSLLQFVSEVVLYLKVWELEKFKEISFTSNEVEKEMVNAEKQVDHWLIASGMRRPSVLNKAIRKLLK